MKSFELLSKIALTMVNANGFSEQINCILEIVGEFIDVSRCYIFLDDRDSTKTSNTFEWCNDGIEPQIEELQAIPYEIIPSWRKMLVEEGRIYSEDIFELPKDVVKILAPQNILSLIIYPLYINNKIQGFIGFDECEQNRKWSDMELNLLKTISGIISNLYEREFIKNKLANEKKDFESLFNTIDDLMIIGDLEGNILHVNNAVKDKLGYSFAELKQMTILDLHPEDQKAEAKRILSAMFAGEQESCPLELITKNDRRFPVETRIWFGNWNEQDCIYGISKDLSREHEALEKFTKLFESNPALMAVSTMPDRKFIEVNTAFLKRLGYTKHEIIGKTSSELDLFVDPKMNDKIKEELQFSGKVLNIEMQIRCKDGKYIDGLFSGEILSSYKKSYFLSVVVDITKQKNLQSLYNAQMIRLSNIIESANLGTWEWNIQTGEMNLNERWAQIIGYKLEELSPIDFSTWQKYTHADDSKKIKTVLQQHFNGKVSSFNIEYQMKHKNGCWIWVHDRGKVIKWDNAGNPLKMFGIHSDITEKKKMENKIREISIRDPLTNLYNRRYIFSRVKKELEKLKRDREHFSISIIDLDHFKRVNDIYGHLAGDKILSDFSDLLRENLRTYDLVGRYGGEEFVLTQFNFNKKIGARRVLEILNIVRDTEFQYEGNKIKLTFSCGISDTLDIKTGAITIEKMLKLADKRLYLAKNTGRNTIVYDDNSTVNEIELLAQVD